MGKAERKAALEVVRAYNEASLTELARQVAAAVDRHRAGEIDVYDLDEQLHHYQRAARELWKFCGSVSGAQVEFVAHTIQRMADEQEPVDWWERGAPRRRSTS